MDKLECEALLKDLAHLQTDPEHQWTVSQIKAACEISATTDNYAQDSQLVLESLSD